jgi:hypothetical protein
VLSQFNFGRNGVARYSRRPASRSPSSTPPAPFLYVIIRFIAWTIFGRCGFKKKRETWGAGMMDDSSTLPVPVAPARVLKITRLTDIPEKDIWLQKQKSPRTRRAYRLDVQHLMRSLAITTPAELRQADHKAVIAWERYMRETEHAAASTIRRRLAALSSLYKHLVRHDHPRLRQTAGAQDA